MDFIPNCQTLAVAALERVQLSVDWPAIQGEISVLQCTPEFDLILNVVCSWIVKLNLCIFDVRMEPALLQAYFQHFLVFRKRNWPGPLSITYSSTPIDSA